MQRRGRRRRSGGSSGSPDAGCGKISPKEEAQRYVDAFNAGEVDALGRVLAPSYRYTDRYAGGTLDRAGHLAVISAVLERVPDRRILVERILRCGDTHVVEGTWTGTPAGTDHPLRTRLVIVVDVADGLITTATAYYQEAELAVE